MNVLKNLFQMRLYRSWFFSLRKDLKQIVIGKEKETSECVSLFF